VPYNDTNIFWKLRFKHILVDMEQRFTSRKVAALTGTTLRQLQWWDEHGIVRPAREGHRRLYSLDDMSEIAVISEMRQRGFSLQRMRKVVRFLQKEFGQSLAATVGGNSEYHLLTDGKRFYVETSARQIVDILKNSKQPLLSICLSDAVRQVRTNIQSSKKASSSVKRDSQRVSKKAL
jgi:DNA-binding transcriptional MerR regulator